MQDGVRPCRLEFRQFYYDKLMLVLMLPNLINLQDEIFQQKTLRCEVRLLDTKVLFFAPPQFWALGGSFR